MNGEHTEQMFGFFHLAAATTSPHAPGMLTIQELHLERARLIKLTWCCLFLRADFVGGFADFTSSSASAGPPSGSGMFQVFFVGVCLAVLSCCSCTARIFRGMLGARPYGACYLLCITRTDTHQLLLWMTRRRGQELFVGVEGGDRPGPVQ